MLKIGFSLNKGGRSLFVLVSCAAIAGLKLSLWHTVETFIKIVSILDCLNK